MYKYVKVVTLVLRPSWSFAEIGGLLVVVTFALPGNRNIRSSQCRQVLTVQVLQPVTS